MQPKPPLSVARLATGLVSAAAALMLLAFCIVVPLQAQQAARLAADSGQAKPCSVSTLCTCQSNEKQLGIAITEYYQDYDERLPPGTQQHAAAAEPPFSGVGWAGTVYSYVKSPNPFKCPDDPTTATAPYYPVSYGFNSNLSELTVVAVNDLSESPMLFEISGDKAQIMQYDEGASLGAKMFSSAGDGTDLHLYSGLDARLRPLALYATGLLGNRPRASGPVSQEPAITGRHLGGSNFLFADGHAHWFLPADVSSGTDANSLDALQMGKVHGSAAGYDTPPYQATFSVGYFGFE